MPSISIDTFFACTLMVSVVLIATALSTSVLTLHVDSMRDTNEEEYFRAIGDYLLSTCGEPVDWGSNGSALPDTLGLAAYASLYPNELDTDKVCRLSSQNAFALTYREILDSARLKNTAIGVSIAPLIDVSISIYSFFPIQNAMLYTFKVHVSSDGKPVTASLHYYAMARGYLSDGFGTTSDDGNSLVTFTLPDVVNGTASLIVFARADCDARIASYGAFSFGHRSPDPLPNGSFLELSPLNYTLRTDSNVSGLTFQRIHALSYRYQYNLTATSNETYAIPVILDDGPIILAVSGSNGSGSFIEWTSYPQIPLEAGSDFKNSECHSYAYIVTIKDTLYEVILRFGGISP